jgi:hypothetical protein
MPQKDFCNTICQDRKSRFIVDIETPVRRYYDTHRKGGLVIAYEDALAEIELANSFSAANAGPPTSPPEARQMPGTM